MKRIDWKLVAIWATGLTLPSVVVWAATSWHGLTYSTDALNAAWRGATVGYDKEDGTAQPVSASTPLPVTGTITATTTGLATSAKQDTAQTSLSSIATNTTNAATTTLQGALTETAPATDTASSGLNGRLQRIAQRLTTLLSGGLPAALAAGGGLKVEGVAGGVAQPISAASLPLPSGAATLAAQTAGCSSSCVSVHPFKASIPDGTASTTVDAGATGTVRYMAFKNDSRTFSVDFTTNSKTGHLDHGESFCWGLDAAATPDNVVIVTNCASCGGAAIPISGSACDDS